MTFICDNCQHSDYQVLYPARGSFTAGYLITDRSYGQHLPIVQCTTCGLIQVFPQVTLAKTLSRYQRFVDPVYEHEATNRSINAAKLLNTIKSLYPTAQTLLDVGCATGQLLQVAKHSNWSVSGVEPSKWATQVARTKGLAIVQGTLDQAKFKPQSFDVITCVDVVEHVISPKHLVRQMVQLLKPGGLLCIVTPSIDSLVARVLRENWWHIRPDHIYYFTKKSLSNLLISNGLHIEKMTSYTWTFRLDYWASRLKLQLPNTLGNLPLTLNFHDSIEVYARKI